MKPFAQAVAAVFAVLLAASPTRAERETVENSASIPPAAFHSETANRDPAGFWTLDRRGRISAVLNFPADGLHTFVAMMRSGVENGDWPQVNILLDFEPVFQTSVNTTNWASYTFATRIERGLHEVSFEFNPDFSSGAEELSFQLHSLAIITEPNAPLVHLPDAAELPDLEAERQRRRAEVADRQILERRRGKLTVWVVEPNGRPASNVLVSVQQRSHEFLFGAALCRDLFTRAATNDEAALYRDTFRRNFNVASTGNALDWSLTETWAGRTALDAADRMADWCDRAGIALRAERVFHGCNVPSWVQKLATRDLRSAVGTRATEITSRFRSQINDYDVVTEPLRCGFLEDRLDPRVLGPVADRILAINPGAQLRINEDGLLTRNMMDRFSNYIRGQITAGVDVAGISAQAHFAEPPNIIGLSSRLDDLARLELPITITDFDCSAPSAADQLACLQTTLTAAFAHPGVEGVLFSGFSESCHPVPSFALFDRDFKPTALGEAYRDLVYGRWWTHAEGRTDRVGRFECEAFFGEYDIEASTPDGRVARATLRIVKSHGSGGISLHLPPVSPPTLNSTEESEPPHAKEEKPDEVVIETEESPVYEPAAW